MVREPTERRRWHREMGGTMEDDARSSAIEAAEHEPAGAVVCTEHTDSNLRGYGILLAFGLVMVVSCVFGIVAGGPGQQSLFAGIGLATGAVLSALSGYMLVVWKNRQVEVREDGIVITDAFGTVHSYGWNDVRIVDNRTTSADGIVFRTRDKREEPFTPNCGNYGAMCELLISMRKLRRIDEAALARKRKMKGLFDVVQNAGREKADESLYLPDDTDPAE